MIARFSQHLSHRKSGACYSATSTGDTKKRTISFWTTAAGSVACGISREKTGRDTFSLSIMERNLRERKALLTLRRCISLISLTCACAYPNCQTELPSHTAFSRRSSCKPLKTCLTMPPQRRCARFLMGMIPKKATAASMSITAKKETQELWFRDRSSAEEQMTLSRNQGPPYFISSWAGLKHQPRTVHVANESSPLSVRVGQTDLNFSFINAMVMGDVNLPLVFTTCLSHGATLALAGIIIALSLVLAHGNSMELFRSPLVDIASLHWNSNTGGIAIDMEKPSLFEWTISPKRTVEGVIGTIPLVAMANFCMENPATCRIQFSITKTVVQLFGRRRRRSPDGTSVRGDNITSSTKTTTGLQVLITSVVIATVSAAAEELVFRGLLPTAIVWYTHSVGLGLLGQAILFGVGQVRVSSPLAENGVFSIMQAINGVWYGAMFLANGGDIMPLIIAHVLYECHILVGAWKSINDQMDYTEDACRCPQLPLIQLTFFQRRPLAWLQRR